MMTKLLLISISILFFSCTSDKDHTEEIKLKWNKFFEIGKVNKTVEFREKTEVSAKTMTFSANKMPLDVFVTHISDTFNVSVIVDEKFKSRQITAEYKNSSLEEVFLSLAKNFNTDFFKIGTVYYLGIQDKEDRSFLVRKVRGLSREDIKSFVDSLISDTGSLHVSETGVLLVTDSQPVVLKVSNVLNDMMKISSDAWVVQFFFVSYRRTDLKRIGADLSGSGRLAYKLLSMSQTGMIAEGDQLASSALSTLAENSVSEQPLSKGLTYDFNLNGFLEFVSNNNVLTLVDSPMVILSDGQESEIKDTLTIRTEKRSISSEGTSTNEGFDNTEVGVILTCKIRETSTGAFLDYKIENSQLVEIVNNAPLTRSSSLKSVVPMKSAGVYLLGELSSSERRNAVSGLTHFTKEKKDFVTQVFARLYTVKQ